MFDIIKKISSLFVLIGIYLYFTSFVYLNFYWGLFGLSSTSVKIDYSQYLVYSYDVISSSTFLIWTALIIAVVLLLRFLVIKKLGGSIKGKKKIVSYFKSVDIIILILCFPFLFEVSRTRAIQDYNDIRNSRSKLKDIQFIFRKDAEYLSPEINIDSISKSGQVLSYDISVLKNDSSQSLRLLGESDQYYVVLRQPQPIEARMQNSNSTVSVLPDGNVYYVAKSDVLLAKIILRTSQ